MSNEKNKKNMDLLKLVTSGVAVADETEENQVDDVAVIPVKTAANANSNDADDEIVIPKAPAQKVVAPQKTAEESHAILRKQRDEARSNIEALTARLEEAEKKGKIYEVAKELIKKDEIDEADLKGMFADYDFTKKEKETLAEKLRETQDKLRHHDITSSPEFNEMYINPLRESHQALAAEFRPIVSGEQISNEKADSVIMKLLESDDVNPTSIKVALHKVRDFYEEDGIEFTMPPLVTMTAAIKVVKNYTSKLQNAVSSWEQDKAVRASEQAAMEANKGSVFQAKNRKQRIAMTNEYMSEFTLTDDYNFLSEDIGHDAVMNKIIASHNDLTEIMDSPEKAPDYKELLAWKAKASMYDDLMKARIGQGKLASREATKAKLESVGRKTTQAAGDNLSENAKLLKAHGVQI